MATLNELYAAKLASSGLTLADAKKLGLEPLAATATAKLSSVFKPLPAIKIPYFDVAGKPLSPHPRWPAFYRLRYLEVPVDQFTQKDSVHKYMQPVDSGVCAYFPLNHPWAKTAADPEKPITITEGEFKAAKACKEGFATIGLGGVWSFKSTPTGRLFLPELEQINWIKRHVNIIFDSDVVTNPSICQAINALANELHQRGARPRTLILPAPDKDSKKVGLDDFLVANSAADLERLMAVEMRPLAISEGLWQFNNEFVFVRNPPMIINLQTRSKVTANDFVNSLCANRSHPEQVVNKDGTISLKSVPTASAWVKWPLRNEVDKIVYAPGKPTVTNNCLNSWPGWGVEPKRGDVKPFLQLLSHIFKGSEPEALPWFLQWCAYPLQYPGTKLFSSVVIHGTRQGTGKTLVGLSLGEIYGENFTEIKQSNLHGNFNAWAENKQFVLGDDVTGTDKRVDADMLKKMITQKELRVNTKYLPEYVVDDCINYIWTSNQPDAFFLEDTDRRFFIHEVTAPPMEASWYVDYSLWLKSGGAAAIFYYLKGYNVEGFNPAGHALRTKAKERMTEDVRSDLGSWVRRLLAAPEEVLRVGDIPLVHDLYTNKELLNLYDPEGRTRTTGNGLGRELKRAGARQVLDGAVIKGPKGQDRFYIVRSQERWSRATISDVQRHLAGTDKPAPEAAKKPKAPKFTRRS